MMISRCFFGTTSKKSTTRSFQRTLLPVLEEGLAAIEAAGTYKRERILTSKQSAEVRTNKPVLNFCANNYLGLADNAQLAQAAKSALDSHGFGLASVRFICGTQDAHKALESDIARFHGYDDAILYGSCFDANAGIFEALLGQEDAVISDSLNHASIIDGVRLCKAQRLRYNHLDLADLEERLRESQSSRVRLIVTDGVFSMDGDIAPLPAICDLADKYNAVVMVDESHATGFMGRTGRGTPEHHGVMERIDIVNSTLGKALGGATGGYTTAAQPVVDILRQRSRPYLFSNSVPPALVSASREMFRMLTATTALRDKLERNTKLFREGMSARGFKLAGNPVHPIAPVMIGDAKIAAAVAEDMLAENIYVIAFSYPVVPKGQARIRVQISAAHSDAHIQRAILAFEKVGKKHKLI